MPFAKLDILSNNFLDSITSSASCLIELSSSRLNNIARELGVQEADRCSGVILGLELLEGKASRLLNSLALVLDVELSSLLAKEEEGDSSNSTANLALNT